MEKLMAIFNNIASVSGRNDKEAILKKNKDNVEFTKLLSFLYNPYIITGIGKKKMDKFKSFHVTYAHPYESIFALLYFVTSKNGSVSDDVVKEVANYINCQPLEVQGFLREVVTKEYKCGITASTINKVYGKNFIPKHDIMLAKSWDDEKHKVKGDFIITEKLDGQRCTVLKENGVAKFYTRKGLQILGMEELEQEFSLFPDNMVYDGELLIVNTDNLSRLERFRATQKRVKTDGIKKDLEFHMYEMLPLDEFRSGKSKAGALARKVEIFRLIDNYMPEFIKQVPILYNGSDQDVLMKLLQEAIDNGDEGIMINLVDAKYECKRSSNLLKAKKIEEKTIDLRIIGFVEGEGKYKGTLGRMNVDYKGNILGVGIGTNQSLTDDMRDEIWNNKDKYLGMIVEIAYDDETSNQDGGESLRYPKFVRLRDDKDEVSYHA